jgi:arsenate reductase
MSESTNVLILCTGNSARSVLGEAILNRLGEGRFRAFSAGSMPTGRVNPGAVKLLESKGYDTSRFRSKSWEEFAGADAPKMDIVITVCDSAAGETCPIWPGAPVTAHWGFPDPAAVQGDEETVLHAFSVVYSGISRYMEQLVALDAGAMEPKALREALADIAKSAPPVVI